MDVIKLRWMPLLAAAILLTGCSVRTAGREETAAFAPAEEKRLVLYTSHKQEVYEPIVREFQEKTGIWVEVVTGGTSGLLERIAEESEKPVCDVMFGGGVESLSAYGDYFTPYACSQAEQLRDGLRPDGDLWVPFSSLPIVFIYNTKLTGPLEVTGWVDLIDPHWKGRIAFADPTVSGSSYTAALTMLTCLPGDDWEMLCRFAENLDGRVLNDSGDVVDAVANGQYSVGVTLEETARKGLARGLDIAVIFPAEGTSAVPDGSALVKNAPHDDNARQFLEFVQSRDVQELVVRQFSRRSVRRDVADSEELPALAELDIVPYDVRWAAERKAEFDRRWRELCGGAAA